MTPQMPLRYRISSWRQLPGAKSNNSKKLHIHVTDFVPGNSLTGFRITIEHDDLGTLFAYILNAKGSLITPYQDVAQEFTPGVLLNELKRFGFLIEYNPIKQMPGNQISLLMTINQLKFDKIRVLNVWETSTGVKVFKHHIVAFKADPLGNWLNSGYAPSIDEYTKAITSGAAIDIGILTEAQDMDWSWLVGWVGNIDDILCDNAEMGLWPST